MNKSSIFLSLFTTLLAACGGTSSGDGQTGTVVLDVRCAEDPDCPNGFGCETEIEHGTESSYCVSDDSAGTSNGECPVGYEQELEHGEVFCKPHGGGQDSSGSGGSDDSGNDSGNDGGSDDSGNDGPAVEGEACASDADCAAGLECETEVENGVTSGSCKPHGGSAG